MIRVNLFIYSNGVLGSVTKNRIELAVKNFLSDDTRKKKSRKSYLIETKTKAVKHKWKMFLPPTRGRFLLIPLPGSPRFGR